MSNPRQKTLAPNMASHLPAAALPCDVQKWRRLARVRNRTIACWLGGLGSVLPVLFLAGPFPALKYLILAAMVALTVFGFSACVAGALLQSRLEKHIQQTCRNGDVSGLGCWIDLLFTSVQKWAYPQMAKQYAAAARAGLLEQLPLLTEDTTYFLQADERHALYKTLYGQDAELISVVLQTVPLLGDARALPFVRHLAAGKGLAATNTAIQAEAQSSLERLQTNLDLDTSAQKLLRASQPPQRLEELLLPGCANSDTEANQLLRANVQN